MLKFEPSINIALSREPAEENPREFTVVPITSTESLVATRGLALHFDILYKAVANNSNPDRALLAVYDFLSDDVDQIRRRAYRIADLLEFTPGTEIPPRTIGASIGIALLLNGQRSHKTGVWLRGKAKAKQLMDVHSEVIQSDDFTFSELAEWAGRQSVRNTIYWRRELEKIRNSRYINQLREAIDKSDHHLEV